jgi:hypothetical protein
LLTIFGVGTIAFVPLVFHRGLKPICNLSFMQYQKMLSYSICIASYRDTAIEANGWPVDQRNPAAF